MKKTIKTRAITLIMSATVLLSALPFPVSATEQLSYADAVETLDNGIKISADSISTENYKDTRFNNPISPDFYCADFMFTEQTTINSLRKPVLM